MAYQNHVWRTEDRAVDIPCTKEAPMF